MSIINLTAAQLRRAAKLKDQIAKLQGDLAKLIGGGGAAPAPTAKAKRAKPKFSAAAIARIRAAQKARWAKIKAAKK
jgi:hypothetical protein